MSLLAGAVVLLGAPAVEGAGEPARLPVYVESVRVDLVSVDVWVTTPDGAVVYGLEPEDFEVVVDGTPVEVTNFSAPQPPDAVAPTAVGTGDRESGPRPGTGEEALALVVLVDNESVTPANRNAVLERLRPTVERVLATGEGRVMLVTAAPTVRVRQPLTADLEQVLEAFEVITSEVATDRGYADERLTGSFLGGGALQGSASSGSGSSGGGGVPGPGGFQPAGPSAFSEADTLLLQVRSSAQRTAERARAAIASIATLFDALAGAPGRKVLLYVGNGIPVSPGLGMLAEWEAQLGSSQGSESLPVRLELERMSLGPLLDDLVGRANAGRLTVTSVDTAPGARSSDSFAESRPGRSSVRTGFSGDVGRRIFQRTLADGTGGRVLANGAGLSSEVETALGDLGSAYSLAFAVDHGGDGALHPVEVKLERSGARVRHRRAYLDKGADERMADRSLAALWLGEASNPLGASLSLGTQLEQPDGSWVVPVVVTLPLRGLVLLPEGEVHVGSVSAWFSARDDRGLLSRPAKQTFTFRVANERLLTVLSQSVSYPVQFLMKPGAKRVAASLCDDNGDAESSVAVDFTVAVGTAADAEAPK